VLRGTFDTVAGRLAAVRDRLAAADEALDAVAAERAGR
jgi:argininosuccinate lyase